MKKYILLVLSFVFALTAVSVWAGGSSEKSSTATGGAQATTLTCFVHYSADTEKASFDYALAALKKDYPNVTINVAVMPNDNDEKIKTEAATGDLPDLLDINASLISLFSSSNKLVVLDPYLKNSIAQTEFLPNASPFFKDKNGNTLSVANSTNNMIVMYYNKKLFADNGVKVPTNYNEFLAAVKAFRAKGITPLALFSQQQWPGYSFWDSLVSSAGQPGGFNAVEAGKASITDPAFVTASKRFVELVNAGLVSKDAFTTGYDQAVASFIAGQAAMFQNGTWDAKNLGDKMGDNVGLLYPTVLSDNGGGWNAVGEGFGNGFSAAAQSKSVPIAAELTGYLAVKNVEGQIIKDSNINNALNGTFTPATPYNGIQQKLADDWKNFNTGTSFWWGLTNPKIQTAIGENVAKLQTGQYDVNSFISDTNKAVKDAMAGN